MQHLNFVQVCACFYFACPYLALTERSWRPLLSQEYEQSYLSGSWFLLSRLTLGRSLNIYLDLLCHLATAEIKQKLVC